MSDGERLRTVKAVRKDKKKKKYGTAQDVWAEFYAALILWTGGLLARRSEL